MIDNNYNKYTKSDVIEDKGIGELEAFIQEMKANISVSLWSGHLKEI